MEKQRRLRTWLENIVNSGKVENLEWLDKDKRIFRIPWKHESRNDWDPSHAQIFTNSNIKLISRFLLPDINQSVMVKNLDATHLGFFPFQTGLYQEWAKFTGKYREGIDKPDYKMFKTRLRCAFNKAPDIEEIVDMRKYKGVTPFRVYQLLAYDKKPTPKKVLPTYDYEAIVPVLKIKSIKPPLFVEQLADDQAKKTMDLLKAVEAEREQQQLEEERKRKESGVSKASPSVIVSNKHKTSEESGFNSNTYENVTKYETSLISSPPKEKFLSDTKENSESQSLILLQYPRYGCTLLKNLFDLQKAGILCDLLLKAKGGHAVAVHANVLCASSTYFKQKVDHWDIGHSGDTEIGCMVISFSDVSFEVLNSIIQFIYLGEVKVARMYLQELQTAASTMKLEDLRSLCEYVLLNEKNRKPVLPKQTPFMSINQVHTEPTKPKQQNVEKTSHISLLSNPHAVNSEAKFSMSYNKVCEEKNPAIVPGRNSLPSSKMVSSIPHPSKMMLTQPFQPSQSGWSIHQKSDNVKQLEAKNGLGKYRELNNQGSGGVCVIAPLSSWHIPQEQANSNPNPNPLDVLCQAVDETIRTESQSDSEDSGAVEDISPTTPETLALSLQPQNRGPTTIQPVSCIPLAVLQQSPIAERTTTISGNNSQSSLVSPLPRATIHHNIDPLRLESPPALVIPTSVITSAPLLQQSPTNGEHQRLENQCPVCYSVMPTKMALEAHMNIHKGITSLRYKQLKQRNQGIANNIPNTSNIPSSKINRKKGSERTSISDEEIQSIINRIKSKTGEELTQAFSTAALGPNIMKEENGKKHGSSGSLPRTKRLKSFSQNGHGKSVDEIVIIEDEDATNFTGMYPLTTNKEVVQGLELTPPDTTSSAGLNPVLNVHPHELIKETDTSSKNVSPNEKLICGKCNNVFASENELMLHDEKCIERHTCGDCGQIYSSEKGLNLHKKHCGVEPVVLDHICDQCGKMFAKESELAVHIEKHEKTKKKTCNVCKKVCKNDMLLRLHIQMHVNSKLKFSCVECGKRFLTKKKLELHVQMHVQRMQKKEKDRLFECDLCKVIFDKKGELIEHISVHESKDKVGRVHEDVKGEEIPAKQVVNQSLKIKKRGDLMEDVQLKPEVQNSGTCDEKDHEDMDISGHISAANEKEQFQQPLETFEEQNQRTSDNADLQSSICSQSFKDGISKKKHLRRHFQAHCDSSVVICQVCMENINIEDMAVHEKSHAQDQPLECPHCSGVFDHAEELNNHIMEDHLESMAVEYECKQCHMKFGSTEALEEHKNVHVQRKKKAKEISTVCTVCKHVFTGKYAVYELRKHICDASAKDEQLVVRSPTLNKVKKDKQGPITRRSRRKRVKTKKDESSSEEEPYFQVPTYNNHYSITKSSSETPSNNIHTVTTPSNNIECSDRSVVTATSTTPTHNQSTRLPPPLVNLNMLSEEVKRHFFPALLNKQSSSMSVIHNRPQTTSVVADPPITHDYGDQSSEEEDLSIMVALKGGDNEEYFQTMQQQKGAIESSEPQVYSKPMRYQPGSLHHNLPNPHHNYQIAGYHQPIPFQSCSYETRFKLPSEQEKHREQPTMVQFSSMKRGYQPLVTSIPLNVLNTATQMSVASSPENNNVQSHTATYGGREMPGLARVGSQIKISKFVTPQIRQTSKEDENSSETLIKQVEKAHAKPQQVYPMLPKKRPIDPSLLQETSR